jgi:hypothetical protein
MSFYGNAWWGYGQLGATQNASFYGVHDSHATTPPPFADSAAINATSFYNGVPRSSSFFAAFPEATSPISRSGALPPLPMCSTAGGLSTKADDASQSDHSTYLDEAFTALTTATGVAANSTPLTEGAIATDTPTALLRKNSSRRLLRRKVSFSGVPQTLPPEVEPRTAMQTPKRMGSRRLQGTTTTELDYKNEGLQPQQPLQSFPPSLQCQEVQPGANNPMQPPQLEQPPPHYTAPAPQDHPAAYVPTQQQQHPYPQQGLYPQQAMSQLQPTLSRNGLAHRNSLVALSRGNSFMLPCLPGRLPGGMAPGVPNYAMMAFPRPVQRPAFNPYRSIPYGVYNANTALNQRQAMSN